LHGKSNAERQIKKYSVLTKAKTMSHCPNP